MGTKKRYRIKFTALILVATLLFSMIPTGVSLAAYESPQGTTPESMGEYQGPAGEKPDISELLSKKEGMTEAEQKYSTQILQLTNSEFLPNGMSQSDLISQMEDLDQISGTDSSDFEVYVYIKLNDGEKSSILTPYISSLENEDKENGLVAAWVELSELSSIASLDEIKSIREVVAPIFNTGSVTSEGDSVLKTDLVRSQTGADGSGTVIGIISNGVDSLSSAVASGDLPDDVVVYSNAIGGDEGTAMLEIVHDLAPGARLCFHDAGTSVLDFCDAIDALVAAGCDVICDDVGWILEPFFEDGTVADHVKSVLSSTDVIYTSSAGNAACSHHQGYFYDDGSGWADFSHGSNPSNPDLYAYMPAGSSITVVLQWDDAFGSSGNDYDVCLINANTHSLLASSIIEQNGDDDPLEAFGYTNDTGSGMNVAIAVEKFSGVPKTLEIYTYNTSMYTNNITAADSIFGHAAVPGVISCGAIDQADSNNDDIEPFSSCGPVTMIGETRQKPDICGIDGVTITGAGGFSNPFYGTSAAAPHIAAVTALLKSRYTTKSSSQIKQLILNNGVDLGNSGYDSVFGYGRCDALAAVQAAEPTPIIYYRSHVQDIGWQGWVLNGVTSGTSGQSRRLEGMQIYINGKSNAIEYRTHVQNIGWQDWVSDGEMAGTSGLSYRLEAIDIRLTGTMATQYDIYYRVHAQTFGWMDWAKNGASAGTAGYAYRLEAIQIQLVEKGGAAPGPTGTPFRQNTEPLEPSNDDSVLYHSHVQDIGWQSFVSDGETSGTSGQSLRLEGMQIYIDGKSNAIEYRTHVQYYGWMGWVSDGEMTGTTGESKRLEAITIRLTGDMAAQYDIYYRVHAQNFGWLGWAKNGAASGTAGFGYRLEAIQIVLVEKGGAAPGSTDDPYHSNY